MIDDSAKESQRPGRVTGTAVALVLKVASLAAEKSVATVKTSDGSDPMNQVASDEGCDFAVGLEAHDVVAPRVWGYLGSASSARLDDPSLKARCRKTRRRNWARIGTKGALIVKC
jgi:hypothetical protein